VSIAVSAAVLNASPTEVSQKQGSFMVIASGILFAVGFEANPTALKRTCRLLLSPSYTAFCFSIFSVKMQQMPCAVARCGV